MYTYVLNQIGQILTRFTSVSDIEIIKRKTLTTKKLHNNAPFLFSSNFGSVAGAAVAAVSAHRLCVDPFSQVDRHIAGRQVDR